MKQTVQTGQCLNALRSVDLAAQQCPEIDPGELGQHMRQADETAEHAMAVEPVGKITIARTSDHVALIPVGPCIGVEPEPQMIAIEFGVGGRGRLAEELPEISIFGKRAKPRELELEQRQMGFIKIDGEHLRRPGREVG